MQSFLAVEGQPYTPPEHVVRRMHDFNERLRLRWSHEKQAWCVEIQKNRATYTGDVSQDAHYRERTDGATVESDAWIRWRDGYWHLGEWQAQPPLSDWCIENLQKYSFDRLGGAKAIDRMLMEQEAGVDRRRERDHADENTQHSKDLYSHMLWKGGVRAAVPRSADGLGVL